MTTLLGYNEIRDLVPEGPPLLMVDRLQLGDDGLTATGMKCVSMDEAYFPGHFPGGPIMPGVLQVAGMTQIGGVLLSKLPGAPKDAVPQVASMRRIKFRNPVFPGDRLITHVELKEAETTTGYEVHAKTMVEDRVTCQGIFDLVFITEADVPTPTELAPSLPERVPELEKPAKDILEIMDIIPHRVPFLLVDRALTIDGGHVLGLKNVTGNEPFFAGLPLPVFPPCLQVESVAQVACVVALDLEINQGKIGYFLAIDKATFHHHVVPGDQVVFDLQLNQRGWFGSVTGTGHVGQIKVADVALKFAIVDREQ